LPKEFDEETLAKFIDERVQAKMKDAQIAHGDTQANRHEHEDPSASAGTPGPVVPALQPAATPPHVMRSWEKTCPNCGLPNMDYKEPDLICSTPGCGYPMGNLPAGVKEPGPGEKTELSEIKPCARCGGTAATVVKH